MADGKPTEVDHTSLHHDHRSNDADDTAPKASIEAQAQRRGLQPPPIVAAMSHEYRAELEKKLRRRIDLRLLPMTVICYILNYIDRNNIAAARLAGLERDLKLDPDSNQFQTAVSILFVGYLLMQVPSNLFLNKIGKPAIMSVRWLSGASSLPQRQHATTMRAFLQFASFWLVLIFSIVASASITNFFPTVVATLGYNNVISLLLTCPPYVLCIITTSLNAWHADRTGERYFHIILPLCVAMVAFIIGAATHATAPRYVAMMLLVPGVYSGYTTALAWISNTLPRPPAKRASALAFINAVSNCSSIYASYLYPKSASPQYMAAFIHNCVACFIAICAATVLRVVLMRLNKKLERGEHVEGAINAAPGEAATHGFRFKV